MKKLNKPRDAAIYGVDLGAFLGAIVRYDVAIAGSEFLVVGPVGGIRARPTLSPSNL